MTHFVKEESIGTDVMHLDTPILVWLCSKETHQEETVVRCS